MVNAKNKYQRIIQQAINILGDGEMTTREIYDIYVDRHFRTCPTIQGLSNILKRHKEFVRLNKYDYPARWRVWDE